MYALLTASLIVSNALSSLPPVSVYASRNDALAESFPGHVDIIGSDEIERSHARDLPELLSRKSAAHVISKNDNPFLKSVALRGFGENAFGRVKIVFDGTALNNVDMAEPNLTVIPLSAAGHIEVIHGPSPVLYGDGAVGGVVSVKGRDAPEKSGVSLETRAGSFNTYGMDFASTAVLPDDALSLGAAYSYLRSDGYRDGSSYYSHTASAGLSKKGENGSRFKLRGTYQNAFYQLPGALTRSEYISSPRKATTPGDNARIWSYGASFESKIKVSYGRWLYLDGGFSRRSADAFYRSSYSSCQSLASAYSLSPRYVDENDLFSLCNKFTAGGDFAFDDYDSDFFSKQEFRRGRFAFFALDELYPAENFSLVAGFRAESIGNSCSGYSATADSSSHDTAFDWEFAAVYRPVENLKTYLKTTRFHRSAFCDELTYTKDGAFLRPETGYSLDLGFESRFRDGFSFSLDAFAMKLKDEIFYDPLLLRPSTGNIGVNCNSPDNTCRIGFETQLSYEKEDVFSASVSYCAVKGFYSEGIYDDSAIPLVPNHRIRADAGFFIFADLEFRVGFSYCSSQYMSGDFENKAPKIKSFSLFDSGLYYEPSWAKGFKCSLTVNNLFDRRYCSYAIFSGGEGYYYPSAGRSFMFTLGYDF